MSTPHQNTRERFSPFRERLYEIIFEADTPEGKTFDIALLIMILGSILVVMLDTVPHLHSKYRILFTALEWAFTLFFTAEYITRIYTVHSPRRYITSFYGIVDLLSILPTYIAIFLPAGQSFMILRAIRLLRVFKIFGLGQFMVEGQIIMKALKDSLNKILVFLFFILILVTIFGSIMYVVEGGGSSNPQPDNQFTSIPISVYWAIVTLTTVGYGDIAPTTPFGQFLAAIIMIMGYAVIAVPTGIVSSEFSKRYKKKVAKNYTSQVCSHCLKEGHDKDAEYCKFCGAELHPYHGENKDAVKDAVKEAVKETIKTIKSKTDRNK